MFPVMIKVNLKADNNAEATIYLHPEDIKAVQVERGFLNQESEEPNADGEKEIVKVPVEFVKVVLYETQEVSREYQEMINGKPVTKKKKVVEEKAYFISDPDDMALIIEQYEKLTLLGDTAE